MAQTHMIPSQPVGRYDSCSMSGTHGLCCSCTSVRARTLAQRTKLGEGDDAVAVAVRHLRSVSVLGSWIKPCGTWSVIRTGGKGAVRLPKILVLTCENILRHREQPLRRPRVEIPVPARGRRQHALHNTRVHKTHETPRAPRATENSRFFW